MSQLNIIPRPVYAEKTEGNFVLSDKTIIYLASDSMRSDAELFDEYLNSVYGFELDISSKAPQDSNYIYLALNNSEDAESYNMSITTGSISITGGEAGVFYGLQSLKQLLPLTQGKQLSVDCCEIKDAPRYKWRGMHLDVSRHYFPKEFIEKYIDYLAMYKMNTFHWHLTDDQGWRIEIKKYPKLTEVGAWRNATLKGHYSEWPHQYDSTRYGGFYTQDDIREIVAYAEKRHVTIVPEIEMPGHSMAALASYPNLACSGGPFDVATEWGEFEDVFCPKEETFKFLEDVLSEVIELFPGKYIHVGGDECPKVRWKTCSECQELMKKEGLKNEEELQSYFTKRIEQFLNSKGKTLIGWDEILEGGLAPNATVMSWRGEEGGIIAARQNHYVVMTPGAYCYFDHYQGNPKFEPLAIGGYTTVAKVYSYEPSSDSLTPEQQNYILGAQGNVWTEYIPNEKQVEYMIFPRMCALAEVVWSPKELRDYNNFRIRLIKHFELLDRQGINYSKAIYEIKTAVKPNPDGDGVFYELSTDFDSNGIYYHFPGTEIRKYAEPIKVTGQTVVSAFYKEGDKQLTGEYDQTFHINKASGKNITLKYPPHKNYSYGGAFTLVDGILGRIPWYGKEWLGFSGTNCEATIDLGKADNISAVTIDVLDDEGSWIYLPQKVELYTSEDGVNFTKQKELSKDQIKYLKRAIKMNINKVSARFIKVIAYNAGKIPQGMPGEGYDSWLFVDEISIE